MNIDLVIVASFLAFNLIFGILSGAKIKNLKEYTIGNRNISDVVLSITIMATLIGGGSSLGTSTEVYKFGIIVIFAKYGVSVGMLLIAYFISPKMEKFFGMISVGEIMGKLYGKNARIITGISGSLLCMGRIAAQILAFGYVTSYFFHIDEKLAIILGSCIVIAYSAFGGIKAVVYTDVLQFIVIVITIPIILNLGLQKIGGYTELLSSLPLEKKTLYPSSEIFRKYFFVFLYMSLPLLSPPFMQRMLMAGNIAQIKKSFISTAIIDFTFTTIAGFIGLITLKLYPNINPNHAFLELINLLTPVGVKGIIIIGLFSIIMSTADSYLNMFSVSTMNDIIKPLNFRLSTKIELLYTRIITLIAGTLAVLMALYFKNIFELAIYSTNFWGPIIVAPLLLGIFGIKGSNRAFIYGVLAGIAVFTLWELLQLKDKTYIYSTIPSVAANLLTFLLYSKFRDNKNNKDIQLPQTLISTTPNKIFQALKLTFKNLSLKISNFNPITFCNKQAEHDSMPYQTFAIFMLINQISYYFINVGSINITSIKLNFISGLLCIIILLKDNLGNGFRKYESLFWYTTTIFTLVVSPLYNLSNANFSLNLLIPFLLSIFLLSVVINWVMFLVALSTGVIITYLCVFLFLEPSYNTTTATEILWFFYTLIFSSCLIVFFKKRNEETEEIKITVAKSLGGIVTHELKAPLIKLFSANNKLKKNIDDNGKVSSLVNAQSELYYNIKSLANVIEMISYKLQGADIITEYENIPINQLLSDAIENYPFQTEDERKLISLNCIHNFDLNVDKQLFYHILYNLLNNAIFYLKNKPEGHIVITTKLDSLCYILCIEDNGPGIPPNMEEKIFRSYYTTKKNGTGLGLFFCKEAMKKHMGDIKCESKYGLYTKFTLFFPKHINNRG